MMFTHMRTRAKKMYIKMLGGLARWMLAKAYELEDKAIMLELEMKDETKD